MAALLFRCGTQRSMWHAAGQSDTGLAVGGTASPASDRLASTLIPELALSLPVLQRLNMPIVPANALRV